MPRFHYKVITKDSKIKEGYLNALSKWSAGRKLTNDGSMVIFVSNEQSASLPGLIPFGGNFASSEQINFYRNLSTMGNAGVSIVESLNITSDQVKSKNVRKAILAIADDAKNGQGLGIAMAKFPKYFPEHLVETVNMGNVSGRLTETLDRISIDLEKDDELKRKVQGAMMYPMVVISLMVIVVLALVLYVLPGIKDVFLQFGMPLPLPTKILISASEFATTNPFILLGAALFIIFFFFFISKIKKGRYVLHHLMLRAPIFGPLLKDYNRVLFFRSMKSLVEGGISIVDAVEIAKKTTKNDVYKAALEKVKPVLLHGIPFSEAIIPYPFLFPNQTQKIIKVGEQAGKMDETLGNITEYYERSVDYKTRLMIVLIEPILIILIGLVIGGLALSIFLPIYSMVDYI